jgi:hypothetical protein
VIGVSDLATVNAGLNATSAVLIGTGFYFIKQKNIRAISDIVFDLSLQCRVGSIYKAGLDQGRLFSPAPHAYGSGGGCCSNGLTYSISSR